jgi:hypothetical protein
MPDGATNAPLCIISAVLKFSSKKPFTQNDLHYLIEIGKRSPQRYFAATGICCKLPIKLLLKRKAEEAVIRFLCFSLCMD